MDHRVGKVGMADDEIRHIGIRLVEPQFFAVETGDVQSGGGGHRGWGTQIPFVQARCVGVHLGFTIDDGGGLGAGRAQLDDFGPDFLGDAAGQAAGAAPAGDDPG